MLKSAGYFSGVACPSELLNEKCCRPYCPFRHNTSTKRAALASSEVAINSPSIDDVNNSIEKIKSSLTVSKKSETYTDSYNLLLNESYNPEPYVPFGGQSTCDIEQGYRPSKTKSVLHGARGATKMAPSKKGQTSTNIYKVRIGPTTDMEYDPVMNYSTSILDKKSKQKHDSKTTSKSGTSKRSHCMEDDTQIPEKKSKLNDGKGGKKSDKDLGASIERFEDDEEASFIIDEEDDGSDVPNSSDERDSHDASTAEEDGGVKNDIALRAMIEIASDDETETKMKSKKRGDIVDLTDDETETKMKSKKRGDIVDLINDFADQNRPSASGKKHTSSDIAVSDKEKVERKNGIRKLSRTEKLVSDRGKVKEKSGQHSEKNLKKLDKKKIKKKVRNKPSTDAKQKDDKTRTIKKKNGTISAKDIDVSDIVNFVDRDEIKKLETELENADRYQECLRIYQESADRSSESCDSSASDHPETIVAEETNHVPNIEETVPGKRRIAHANAASSATSLRKPIVPRKRISTPAQMMMKRLEIIEQERANNVLKGENTSRIAHKVSNRMASLSKGTFKGKESIKNLEKKIQENPWYPKKTDPTVSGTATKGVARVAHQARDVEMAKDGSVVPPRPRIAVDRFSKVPTNVRQRYLTIFINECLRIYNNNHEKAYKIAQNEEDQCKKRSSGKNIYLSLAASTLKRLREMPTSPKSSTECNDTEDGSAKVKKAKTDTLASKAKSKKIMSHGKLLDTNTKTCKGGYTIEKKEERSDLSVAELYETMCRYIMTSQQLDENGYPRPCGVPGKAEFRSDPPPKPFNTTNKKICAHCGKEFLLDKKGNFTREEECTYHWGRAYMTRVGKGWEKRYTCCQEREGVEGCTIGDTHVHADNKLDRSGYVRTLSKSPPPDGNSGVFTVDCEMSYTVNGLELTRVSVLDHNCKVVYDTFVKPSGRVLDYNTRWSGITEENLKNVKTTLRDVQAAFLTKFSADTILMGHSLESDLVALRIIHETVIDTSIVFPHKRGPPFKRSLRNVASENIGLIIQNTASEGHDSAEDAAACMKLMLWKLAEDRKLSQK